jgi:hypothetical protein
MGFFAALGNMVIELQKRVDKRARECLEAAGDLLKLIEYHGGDYEALMYVSALAYLEQELDAKLEERLRRLIQLYGEELELGRLWTLLDRNRRRASQRGSAERVARIGTNFRRYGSHRNALNTLANYYQEDESTILEDTIKEIVCSEGAYLLLDIDISRKVGNHIRAEATQKRKAREAEKDLRAEYKPTGIPALGVQRPREARNVEQDSFDALDYLERLDKKASESSLTKPTPQELESLVLSAFMSDREVEIEVKRKANQIKQERRRAIKKFQRIAEI